MKSSTSIEKVQALNDRLTALIRFISRLANNFASFFHVLKNNKIFEWTNECEEAFKKIKEYLETPLILTQPKLREALYVYLVTFDKAVSSVLIKEEGDVHKSIYFTSQTL